MVRSITLLRLADHPFGASPVESSSPSLHEGGSPQGNPARLKDAPTLRSQRVCATNTIRGLEHMARQGFWSSVVSSAQQHFKLTASRNSAHLNAPRFLRVGNAGCFRWRSI